MKIGGNSIKHVFHAGLALAGFLISGLATDCFGTLHFTELFKLLDAHPFTVALPAVRFRALAQFSHKGLRLLFLLSS